MAEALPEISRKSRLVAALLCWLLGGFGAHRFYLGKTKSAIIQLVLTILIVTAIVSFVWVIIDLIKILVGSFTDVEGKPVFNWTEPQSLPPPSSQSPS